jgi:large subunit ribosomal protein L32e
MTKEQSLKLRKALKAKKPNFLREDYQKRACIPLPWRRPRGVHSKLRHRFAGHRALVNPGYGSPKEAYGLSPSGYEQILVHTISELQKLNSKTQGAILGSTIGLPRKIALLTEAKKLGVRVLNVKDVDAELKTINDSVAARKDKKAKIAKEKESKAKEKEAKKPELAQKVSEASDDEQKKKAKEEKDRVLTSRQV